MPSSKSQPSENFSAVHVHLSGRVQGVGFRYFTEKHAVRLGLKGWVRNGTDGSVEAEVEGPKEIIEEWLMLLKQGPSISKVDELTMQWIPYNHRYKIFKIL